MSGVWRFHSPVSVQDSLYRCCVGSSGSPGRRVRPRTPPTPPPGGLLTSAFCPHHFPTPVLSCAPSTPPSPTCVVWKPLLAVLRGLCSTDSPFYLQASCLCDLSQGERVGPESGHAGTSSLGGFGPALSLLAPCLRVDVGLWTGSCSSSVGLGAVSWVLTWWFPGADIPPFQAAPVWCARTVWLEGFGVIQTDTGRLRASTQGRVPRDQPAGTSASHRNQPQARASDSRLS